MKSLKFRGPEIINDYDESKVQDVFQFEGTPQCRYYSWGIQADETQNNLSR
jgi:hypothetical protein